MKIAYLVLCAGLVACGSPFTSGAGGNSSSTPGEGGSTFVPPPTGTTVIPAPDAGSDASCTPKMCDADSCGSLDDGCGNPLDCGSCPDQVQGYPAVCISNTCQPLGNTISGPECYSSCMNQGAWDNCLSTYCLNMNCTIQTACMFCDYLSMADPNCVACLHENFPGQSCGG